MSVSPVPRSAALELMYHCYLADQDLATYMERVSRRYQPATLTRLMQIGARMTRRAAALGLGLFAGYDTNAELAAALHDEDRGVRMLAENAMRSVWCRQGDAKQQGTLDAVIRLNEARDFNHALRLATQLIEQAPELAEAWNQRAIASFRLGRYLDSIQDCRRAIELNPHHFGAVAGMGQCYLYLGNMLWALESFRKALEINPNLEAIRANIAMLERKLKR